ncbi:MAG TPA: hypothetical protein VHL77_07820 [Ferruginibacter sp.]|jgi:hypothetical protein|nr:hypothetical protein [Ferruginibacter sp.]
MNRILNAPPFHHRSHLNILKTLVITANVICLSTYLFLHIIFYDLEFSLGEELLIALKIVGWATATAVGLSFIIFATDALRYFIRHRKQFKFFKTVHYPGPTANKHSSL